MSPDTKQIGAVDIGGTKIAAGIVRQDGTLLHRLECPSEAERGYSHAVQRIQNMLQQAIDVCGPIDGVGIGCPGPLDPLTGVIGNVGTLPGWQNGPLADDIGRHFGLRVAVENDADAAALAEFAWGSSPTANTLLYVTVSTGIGGGLVHNGQLYRGAGGAHPEFGHQVIDPSGPLCYCGISGCWESLASGTAMSASFLQLSPSSESLPSAQICERARQGDSIAQQAVRRTAHYLGLGLSNLVTLFAPDVVCLGGGVMQSSDLFLPDVQTMVQTLCTQVPVERTTITLSALGREVGLLGAARSFLLRYP